MRHGASTGRDNVTSESDCDRISASNTEIPTREYSSNGRSTDGALFFTNTACLKCDDQTQDQCGTFRSALLKIGSDALAPSASTEYFPHQPSLTENQQKIRNSVISQPLEQKTVVRAALPHQTAIQQPTPELQTSQGVYAGTIEHLERTAELFSMSTYPEIKIENSNPIIPSLTLNGVQNQKFSGNSGAPKLELTLEGKTIDSPNYKTIPSESSPSDRHVRDFSASYKDYPSGLADILGVSVQPHATGNFSTQGDKSHKLQQISEKIKQENPLTETTPTQVMEKMFADFDGSYLDQNSSNENRSGVSYGNRRAGNELSQKLSVSDRLSRASSEMDQQMVYYPAPVPTMLNLPKRLSQKPQSIPPNHRKSQLVSRNIVTQNMTTSQPDAAKQETLSSTQGNGNLSLNPSDIISSTETLRPTRNIGNLPPQLRASNFFEQKNLSKEVFELKDQSAVATLNSILDASAYAPVCAFTDHTFAGNLGLEVYGKNTANSRHISSQVSEIDKNRNGPWAHSGRLKNKSHEKNGAFQATDQAQPNLIKSSIDDESKTVNKDTTSLSDPLKEDLHSVQSPEEHEPDDQDSEDEQLDDEIYHGAPTTLLAELQMRKQRQKQRTQPLTKTFPNGIHSTLLELDKAIQTEQKTRRKCRTVLAWEEPAISQVQDDEDVPLAILYSNKPTMNHPLGLLEQHALEENESLSQRRNRLRGRLTAPPPITPINDTFALPSELEEEETLKDRARRLKAMNTPLIKPIFDEPVLSTLEKYESPSQKKEKESGNESAFLKETEEEETLGQRRKRLQAERELGMREVSGSLIKQLQPPMQTLNSRKSMAELLSAHPQLNTQPPLHYEIPTGGLLAMHEKQTTLRSASMHNLKNFQGSSVLVQNKQNLSQNLKGTSHIQGTGISMPSKQPNVASTKSKLNSNNFALGKTLGNNTTLASSFLFSNADMGVENNSDPSKIYIPSPPVQGHLKKMSLNLMPSSTTISSPAIEQGQMDRVERWRQSVQPLSKPTA
ncbi:hypothetical protein Golomagni_00433 [Golovinomyces magnicellulatus]|nr:hypothetical protein Golomagni_00433 [Golovinomyces magnicellulatus]